MGGKVAGDTDDIQGGISKLQLKFCLPVIQGEQLSGQAFSLCLCVKLAGLSAGCV